MAEKETEIKKIPREEYEKYMAKQDCKNYGIREGELAIFAQATPSFQFLAKKDDKEIYLESVGTYSGDYEIVLSGGKLSKGTTTADNIKILMLANIKQKVYSDISACIDILSMLKQRRFSRTKS